jgi:tetratricopeptide (TPR) repeat protein
MKTLVFGKAVPAFILPFCVILAASCASFSGRRAGEQALYGMIYDGDNRPVHNAEVYVNGTHMVSSDIQGHFVISGIKPEIRYTVSARKEGYEELQLEISFPDPSYILYLRMISASQLLAGAEDALLKKDWLSAETLLSRARNTGGDPGEIGFLRGVLLFGQGRYQEALSVLVPLAETEKTVPYLLLFIADIYQFRLEDPLSALPYLNKFLELRHDPEVAARREAAAVYG